ncbi:hypothetical protein EYF80_013101 [Liparis tanakae]|uniref:Uncharacterized protein n=1 Tax=Liparis tanakae TaxID=230148 RepID=A0A4Z2IF38_9TELE|nr:hypothetical protein EYF80_013101 [Liparis tanakae]
MRWFSPGDRINQQDRLLKLVRLEEAREVLTVFYESSVSPSALLPSDASSPDDTRLCPSMNSLPGSSPVAPVELRMSTYSARGRCEPGTQLFTSKQRHCEPVISCSLTSTNAPIKP